MRLRVLFSFTHVHLINWSGSIKNINSGFDKTEAFTLVNKKWSFLHLAKLRSSRSSLMWKLGWNAPKVVVMWPGYFEPHFGAVFWNICASEAQDSVETSVSSFPSLQIIKKEQLWWFFSGMGRMAFPPTVYSPSTHCLLNTNQNGVCGVFVFVSSSSSSSFVLCFLL